MLGWSTMTQKANRSLLAPAIAAMAAITTMMALSDVASANRSARSPEEKAARDAGEPIMAIVSIKSQRVTFYDAEGWILKAPVSTGTRGRETPAGVFAILQKNADHRSNLYDDAHMPHMQRLTWNGIALHGGPLPGYAASHGCVRMPYGFAEKLFDMTRIGMRVIVSPDDATPMPFSHPALLVPDAHAVASAPVRAEKLALEAAEAARAVDETKKLAKTAEREAASARSALRKAERQKASFDADLASAEKRVAKAKSDDAKARAEDQRLKAAARATEAAAKLESVQAEVQPKLDAADKAAEASKEAATRKTDTAKAADAAKLALEPVSIYISRAAQKLYVRRNTRKPWPDGGEVFDATIEAPVTIRDADMPIGTHVFTAMASEGAGLRWTAVSIDASDDAKNALDRISIPSEVLDQIAPTALPRSSIIVSDEPLSKETNYRTEFVAVLSNQPQGGFKTRKPTPRVPPPVSQPWGGGGFFSFFDQPAPPPPSDKNRRRKPTKQVQADWFW